MNSRSPTSTTCGIYLIGCTSTGKVYIGRSSDVGERIKSHFYILRKGTHYNSDFQRDFNKFGEDHFYSEILKTVEVDDNETLIKSEQEFLNLYSKEELYTKRNSNSGAVSGTITEETRKKLGDRQKGCKNHFYGKQHSEEHLAMLKTNNPSSRPEVGAKIAEAQRGRKKMIDSEGKDRRVKAEDVESKLVEGWKLYSVA